MSSAEKTVQSINWAILIHQQHSQPNTLFFLLFFLLFYFLSFSPTHSHLKSIPRVIMFIQPPPSVQVLTHGCCDCRATTDTQRSSTSRTSRKFPRQKAYNGSPGCAKSQALATAIYEAREEVFVGIAGVLGGDPFDMNEPFLEAISCSQTASLPLQDMNATIGLR